MKLSEFNSAVRSYGEAHRVIRDHRLQKYLVLPGVISLAYCLVYFLLAWYWASRIELEITNTEGWLATWPGWLEFLLGWLIRFFVSISDVFLKVIFWAGVIWLFLASFKYVVQVLLSPLLTKLSEVVEKKVYGTEPPKMKPGDYIRDIVRALRISVRNLFHEIILCIAAGWIPVVGGFIAFAVSCFYMGFGFMDYTMERKRLSMSQSISYMRRHRGMTLGIGFICQLGMLVPVLGWLLMPTYATTAATLEMLKTANSSANSPHR